MCRQATIKNQRARSYSQPTTRRDSRSSPARPFAGAQHRCSDSSRRAECRAGASGQNSLDIAGAHRRPAGGGLGASASARPGSLRPQNAGQAPPGKCAQLWEGAAKPGAAGPASCATLLGRSQPRGLPTYTRTHTHRLLSTDLSLALQALMTLSLGHSAKRCQGWRAGLQATCPSVAGTTRAAARPYPPPLFGLGR